MVEAMRPGSVVVDLAAETGGNVEGVRPGEEIQIGGAVLWGGRDVASQMPVHASQLYAMNIYALLGLTVHDGEASIDLDDEILDGCSVVLDGEVRNEAAQAALKGGA
jgi:NAD(P) transhydrogenase subunit alpha